MKKLAITIILLASVSLTAFGQFYQLSTNLTQTNLVAASSTQTSTLTNTLDVRRFRTIGIAAIWSGSTTATNQVTWTFLGSPDGTNWEVYPRWSLVATNYGTNRVTAATNVSVLDAGYVKPYQVINSSSAILTNVSVFGQVKEYPRN